MSRSAAALPDISRPTSKPSLHAELFHRVVERVARDVERQRRAHLARQLEAVVVHVGDDDVARADEAHDRRGHDADRTGAGDQHVFADDIERQRGVHRIAERIEDRRDLVIDGVRQLERVDGRNRRRTRRSTRAIHADADGVAAQVPPPGAAVAAVAASDVAFAGDAIAGSKPETSLPTSTISPQYSWPTAIGTGIVFCAHASQL